MIKRIIIDMDGCLCNDKHRRHYAKLASKLPLDSMDQNDLYNKYHSLLSEDKPYPVIMGKFVNKYYTIICTARPEKYKAETIIWLKKKGIKYDQLLMRPDGDLRPSPELKVALTKNIDKNNTIFIDDRRSNVLAMMAEGFMVYWVNKNGG